MSLRRVKKPVSLAPEENENNIPSPEEQIRKFKEEQKANNVAYVPSLQERVEGKFNLPVEQLNKIPQPNQLKPTHQIHLPILNNETKDAGKGNIPPLFFDATVASSLYKEGWHKATILAVEPTKPTQLKDGSLCQRARFKWFLQDQQINLIDNVLLVHYQDSVIIQVINSCIQPNENRSQFDLLNLVNRQVMVRIEKTEKDNRNYFNVVEVKSLKNN